MARRTRTPLIAIVGCFALAFCAVCNVFSFVLGPQGMQKSAERKRAQLPRGANGDSDVSEEQRAAALRLPSSAESGAKAAATEEEATSSSRGLLPSAMGGVEISSSQRAALRLQSAGDEAEFDKEMQAKRIWEESLKQEQLLQDGSAMGPFGYVYMLFAAGVLWTWIMNFYRMWELGHPQPPQF